MSGRNTDGAGKPAPFHIIVQKLLQPFFAWQKLLNSFFRGWDGLFTAYYGLFTGDLCLLRYHIRFFFKGGAPCNNYTCAPPMGTQKERPCLDFSKQGAVMAFENNVSQHHDSIVFFSLQELA